MSQLNVPCCHDRGWTLQLDPPRLVWRDFGSARDGAHLRSSHDARMDTAAAAERACASVTDSLQMIANEPSLGLYYVNEHIQRSVPALVADKAALGQAADALRGADLDAGFALEDMIAATAGGTHTALANTARLAAMSAPLAAAARPGT